MYIVIRSYDLIPGTREEFIQRVQEPTVHHDQASGHVIRSSAGEEDDDPGDVVWDAHTAQGNLGGEGLQKLIRNGGATRSGSLDAARSDGIDCDVVRAELQSQRFCYHHHTALRCVVMHEVTSGMESID